MSLQEKLEELSRIDEERRAEEFRIQQEVDLEPIRSEIKKLNSLKEELELILEQIAFVPESGSEYGMRGIGDKVFSDRKKIEENLTTHLNKNEAVLKTLNVNTIDELSENSNFSDTEEVRSYKTLKEATDTMPEADQALLNKLSKFEIIEDGEDVINKKTGFIDFNALEAATTRKIEDIENMLNQLEAKTPEGRPSAIENISENLKDDLPKFELYKNKGTGLISLSFLNSDAQIIINGDSAEFRNWYNAKLIPKSLEGYNKDFGEDIANESLILAFRNKIEEFQNKQKDESGYDDALTKEVLERNSNENYLEAATSYREFNDAKNNLLDTISSKSQSLTEKGLYFPEESIPAYGAKYSDFYSPCEYETDNRLIHESMQTGMMVYPPKLYFDSLKTYLEERTKQVIELENEIIKIENDEDITRFSTYRDSIIGNLHRKMLETRFSKVKVENINGSITRFDSYGGAGRYFEQKEKNNQEIREKFVSKIETGVLLRQTEGKLQNELRETKFSSDIRYIENALDTLNKDKLNADNMLQNLARQEISLPNEKLILSGREVRVPSVEDEIVSLRDNITKKRVELKKLEDNLRIKKQKKPIYFEFLEFIKFFKFLNFLGISVSDRKTEIRDLETKYESLKNSIEVMSSSELNNLYGKSTYIVKTEKYSNVEKIVEKLEKVEGYPNEIFNQIKKSMQQIIDSNPPENMMKLYDEYNELKSKL